MEGMDQEKLMNKAQNIWSMLDNMAQEDPQAYRQFIDKQMAEGKEYMKWKSTPPETHMCVLTQMLVGDTE